MVTRRNEYDIAQCFGIFYHTTAAVIMKYLYKKKVINRIECAGEKGDLRRIKKIKFRFLITFTWKKVDKLIAISREIYNDLINCGVHKEKIASIPNSVDTEYFTPSEIKIWKNPFQILFVGRLTEQKGVGVLLEALKNIITKGYNDLLLTIVGDGDLRKELENMALNLDLKKYVTFTGYKMDVMQYYRTSHILVLPSNWEGLPLVLLEGMACGLPIVASDLRGNREGIEDGINGYLFAPGNKDQLSEKIIFLINYPEKAKHMGQINREKSVTQFSTRTVFNKYVELYKSLLGN
jgi:glycosyltransferase involved in cell wall biosynthesis